MLRESHDITALSYNTIYGSGFSDSMPVFRPLSTADLPQQAPTNPSEILSELTVWMKYARYKREQQRRETWPEICDRNREMHLEKYPHLAAEINRIYDTLVIPKKVLPSMRSMQFAGRAIKQQNSRMFNCAYAPVDSIDCFGEIMFLLLGGTGMGYSVQQRHINQLPPIHKPLPGSVENIQIPDNIEGWGDAVKQLLFCYTEPGHGFPKFDLSLIRPKGAELVTSGGKAPGPEPLRLCLQRVEAILQTKSTGDKLTDIEVHDIICHIADAVYAGGIRRAALICLFDRFSTSMLNSKSSATASELVRIHKIGGKDAEGNLHEWIVDIKQDGKIYPQVKFHVDDQGHSWDYTQLHDNGILGWWVLNPQRGRANNSAVLPRGEVSAAEFAQIWRAVEASGSGEPGVYWTNDADWGTNPCVETALRPYQFCNLVEINASSITDLQDMYDRIWGATVLGTLQAGYTNFNYLRDCWKENTEKDALLGVSMTGMASRRIEQLGLNLDILAQYSKSVNADIAARIGINPSARITCIKPAGTTSLTLGTSSGIHAWHDKHYIRRVRVGKQEAIYQYLAINCPEIVEDCQFNPASTAIVSVPQRAPEGSLVRTDETAMEMLERIKDVYKTWVLGGHADGINTHNISATVSLKPEEWSEVGVWMWDNKDYYNGISVLPYDGGTYVQAPFETIDEAKFFEMLPLVRNIDLSQVFENQDGTDLVQELACAGGLCEIP